jgi:hypothetical protein
MDARRWLRIEELYRSALDRDPPAAEPRALRPPSRPSRPIRAATARESPSTPLARPCAPAPKWGMRFRLST